ncbi:MAG: 5-oxoprolinase subunit PxpA [Deferrisomatales bacterium]|nr:5-oxoprolinase subunit PxpA [Deferrisomatales bacterium]
MRRIDLNCDMGEGFGAYRLGFDDEVIRYITSANVACGWHAGDPGVMERTVAMAAEAGVGVGAHPGYPDLLGFGRRNLDCTPEEVRRYVVYQIGALQAFCRARGVPLQHVKPHGALYLTAVEREEVARAVAEAVVSVDPSLLLVALAGAKGEVMRRVGERAGLRVVYEAFPDRAYTPEGTLAPRRLPGTVIQDPAEVAGRALRMASEGVVLAVDGTPIPLEVQTLCVHGDTPSALDLVREIRSSLEGAGVRVVPMGAGS